MLDQDTALALVTVADEAGARLALVGDRHQLPAVGRGGVLDLAADVAAEGACLTLETVLRFADPEYAALSLRMRTGEQPGEVFDRLLARGDIEIHASEVERQQRLSNLPVGDLVTANTREHVAALNAATRDRHVARGRVDDRHVVTTGAGERIGLGDTVTTRRNDRTVGVANRETWTVTALGDAGSLVVVRDPGTHAGTHPGTQGGTQGGTRAGTRAGTLRGTPDPEHPERVLPAGYVREHVELGYARTVYGAQGETVGAAHLAVGDNTGAASAYVAMTRGRNANTAHLVAESVENARGQWLAVFGRDRADLGPRQAAHRAGEDLDRYGSLEWDESLEVTDAASRRLRLSQGRDCVPGHGNTPPARGPSR